MGCAFNRFWVETAALSEQDGRRAVHHTVGPEIRIRSRFNPPRALHLSLDEAENEIYCLLIVPKE
jgi:hypothetical protein